MLAAKQTPDMAFFSRDGKDNKSFDLDYKKYIEHIK